MLRTFQMALVLLPGGRHEGRIWQPFLLPLELKKQRNNRNDRLSCTENVHKIIRARIPFIPKNVWDVAITTGVNQKVLPVLSTETLLHIWLSTEYYGFRPSSTAVDTVS